MPAARDDTTACLIHYFLGDPFCKDPLTIQQWREAAAQEDAALPADADSEAVARVRVSHGCALLYDSFLDRAGEVFFSILERQESVRMQAIACLGWGRYNHFLGKMEVADDYLGRAAELAARSGDDLLEYVSLLLKLGNRSDWGVHAVAPEHLPRPVDGADEFLLQAYRAYTVARMHLRYGCRSAGLETINAVVGNPEFAKLAPVPRGQFLRTRGVLHSVLGKGRQAHADFKEAIETFRAGGYQLGEVQAALSMARIQVPIYLKNAEYYLKRAATILEDVAGPNTPPGDKRQMPKEQAAILSRWGDCKFARREYQEALDLYMRDLNIAATRGDHPRAHALITRAIGRTFTAMRRLNDAVRHLQDSVNKFEAVRDTMNAFFSRVHLCEALLEGGDVGKAEQQLKLMEDALARNTDRDRESGIVGYLHALLSLRRGDNPILALRRISQAKAALGRSGQDYYSVRALMVEAEILRTTRDYAGAVDVLCRARRAAMSLEVEDLKSDIDSMLETLRRDHPGLVPSGYSDLERLCEAEGFVRCDVTVMFADLRGYTKACRHVNPSIMAEFICEFADHVSRCACRHDGQPVRFLGDCVMTVFATSRAGTGLPPKELRAVRAARDLYDMFRLMRERWGLGEETLSQIGMGMGVATGMVVAGRYGSDLLGEFSVIGDATNLASRLQEQAGDGEIVMCPATAAAVAERCPGLRTGHRDLALKGIGAMTAAVIAADDLTDLD